MPEARGQGLTAMQQDYSLRCAREDWSSSDSSSDTDKVGDEKLLRIGRTYLDVLVLVINPCLALITNQTLFLPKDCSKGEISKMSDPGVGESLSIQLISPFL